MNDSLPQLPEYDPRSDLWVRIEADLDRNEESSPKLFSRIVGQLPTYEPKTDLWFAIENDLDTPIVRPLWNKPQTHWLWTGLTAAAVVAIVGIWLFLRPEATEVIRIEYAVEQATLSHSSELMGPDYQSPADKRAEVFIASQCASQQAVCQQPEVHELRSQLTELTVEQQRIKRERQIFGDDPALVQAQVKIENQRAQVTKELISILRS